LTGTWDGPFGPPQTVSFQARWTATQTNATVTGPIALFRVADDVAFTGTLRGILSGTRLDLTYTVPRGSVPGAPDCIISGTSTIPATATLLGGTMTTLTTNCQPISLLPSSLDEFSLVKQ
jgi:hypothetical protein